MEKSEEKTGFIISIIAGFVFLAMYLYFRIMAEFDYYESGNAFYAGITFFPMLLCFFIALIFYIIGRKKKSE